ncbi:MAG: MFS transporter [Pseudomonadota bacterium]
MSVSVLARWSRRWLLLEPGEARTFVLAFGYFFALIGSYMLLRPVRETLAVRAGETEWLFSSVFVIMLLILPLFGWLVSTFPKRIFLPASYAFFILNLCAFGYWLEHDPESLWAGRVFFVWLSVYNMFVVSLFWSLMVDVFRPDAARRLFGPIAAGGSLGGLVGPLISILNVDSLGTGGLVLTAAAMLVVALCCQLLLLRSVDRDARGKAPIGGSIWAGARSLLQNRYLLGLALVLVFMPLANTMLYFIQRDMVGAAFATDAARLKWFGLVDFGTQALALILQFFVTSRLLRRIGPSWTLVIMPVLTVVGFAALAAAPGIVVLGVFQALRRGGEYGLMKPARELLYTPVSQEAKYKTKNFIDTAVYRGGDMGSGWLYRALSDGFAVGLVGIASLGALAAAVWTGVAWRAGRSFEVLTKEREQTTP